MNKSFLLTFITVSTFLFSCQTKPRITHEAKMDSLAHKILNTDFIYCGLDSVPVYLVTGDIIKPNKTYVGFDSFDSVRMSSIGYDSIKDKYVDWIKFDITKVNSDTTDIYLYVSYTASIRMNELASIDQLDEFFHLDTSKMPLKDTSYIHINTKVSYFNFKIDSVSNNWKLFNSSSEFMH